MFSDSVAQHPGALAVSADGKFGVHIEKSGSVVLWDANTFNQLEKIANDGYQPSAVTISPDGDLIAIGSFNSQGIVIWSRKNQKTLKVLKGHSGGVSALAFSPNGLLLASGGDDATARIWEISTGKNLNIFDSRYSEGGIGAGGIAISVGFAGNEKVLAVNEWYGRHYDVDRGTTLWDIDEKVEMSTREVAPPNRDTIMRSGHAIGGKGWLLAYTGQDGLMVERVNDCKTAKKFPDGKYAETVAADQKGRWVAVADYELLTFYGMDNKQTRYDLDMPARPISLLPSADGRYLFALVIDETHINGNEHFIIGRDAETVTRGAIYRISVPAELLSHPPISVSEDASHCKVSEEYLAVQAYRTPEKPDPLIVQARYKLPAKILPAVEGGQIENSSGSINPPRDMHFSSSEKLYVLFHPGKYLSDLYSGVAVWDTLSNRQLNVHFDKYAFESSFRMQEGWVGKSCPGDAINILTGKPMIAGIVNEKGYCSTIISDQDNGDIYQFSDGNVKLYSPSDKRLRELKFKDPVSPLAARNGRLAVFDEKLNLEIRSVQKDGAAKKYKPLFEPDGGTGIEGGALLSPDGRFLQVPISGVDSPMSYPIYDLSNGKVILGAKLLASFPAQSNRVVVPGDRLHRLHVWDLDKGKLIAQLPRHENPVASNSYEYLVATISDDGQLVASASMDGVVRIWDIDAHRLLGETKLEAGVTAMAFDSNSQRISVGLINTHVVVLQVPARNERTSKNY